MRKEQITDKEAICLLFLFIAGCTLIMGFSGEAQNDAWMIGITGALYASPMIAVYARLISLFHDKDLFEILECVFGKILGKIISLLYVWYAFHLGALVIRMFGEFLNAVAIPETPMMVTMLGLGIVCIYAVRSGIEVMSRTSAFFLPFMITIIVIVQIVSFFQVEPNFLKPFLGRGIMPVLKGGFSAFTFPYAETVLAIGCFNSLRTKKSPYKVYYTALLIAAVIFTVISARNIMVLGNTIDYYYFPSHVAVSRIAVGDFVQRIEITVAIVLVISVFAKASLCLLVTARGIARVCGLQDYRSVVIQTGLLTVFLAKILYNNTMMMQYWAFKIYPWYALPFQVVIPLILWITAEIRKKKLVGQNSGSAAPQGSG